MRSARSGWSLSCSTWRRRTGWPSPPRHDRRSRGARHQGGAARWVATAAVTVTGGQITGWSATGKASGGDCPGCGRPVGVPRVGGQPRPRQRAGAYPLGRIRHRHQGRKRRWHTAIVDMPLNSIPPTIDGITGGQRRAAVGQCAVDVAFWGGLTPDSVDEIEALAGEGVCGFKAFLVDSGVSEFPPVSRMCSKGPTRARRPRSPAAGPCRAPRAHQELPIGWLVPRSRRPPVGGGGWRGQDADRPGRGDGAAVHILHLASGDAVELIAAAQAGLPITAETCPHYLVFAAEDIDPRATLQVRPADQGDGAPRASVGGPGQGVVGMVVSDHSPAPPEMKQSSGDFAAAWGGISSLQLRLAATWTAAAARGIPVEKLVGWLADGPGEARRSRQGDDRAGRTPT